MSTTSNTTRLWLIRHGEPAEEARGRCYGSLEVELSEAGRAQMVRVAEYLKDEPIAAIYSSPQQRALESANVVSARVPTLHGLLSRAQRHERPVRSRVRAPRPESGSVQVMADLREIDFGDFEGLPYDEIAARYPGLYRQWMEAPTEVRFPNGESFGEMRSRVLGAFDVIRCEREGQTIAMVGHGGVNRILIAWALQIPDQCLFRVAQDYAAVNLLEIADGIPSVKLVNHRVTSGV